MSGSINGSIPAFQTSPNTCGIMSLIQSNSVFSTAIINSASALSSEVNTLSGAIASIPEEILNQISFNTEALISSLGSTITNSLTGFINHLTNQISGLVTNLGMVSSGLSAQLGLLNSGCSLPSFSGSGATPTNPCLGMNAFFNSIMDGGSSLINSMGASIGSAMAAVNYLASAPSYQLQSIADNITASVQAISNIGGSMISMANSEITSLTNLGSDMLNFGNTNNLISLANNPCAAMVIGSVGTSELLNYLSI